MKKLMTILSVVVLMMMAIVPMTFASAEGKAVTMYVSSQNGKGVRVRSTPTADNDKNVIMTLGEGRPVNVFTKQGEFIEVSVLVRGKVVRGYIMNKFLSWNDPTGMNQNFKAVKNNTKVKVLTASANGTVSLWNTTNKLNVNKVRNLSATETLTVVAESRAWLKVTDANGVTGYVAKAYVTAC